MRRPLLLRRARRARRAAAVALLASGIGAGCGGGLDSSTPGASDGGGADAPMGLPDSGGGDDGDTAQCPPSRRPDAGTSAAPDRTFFARRFGDRSDDTASVIGVDAVGDIFITGEETDGRPDFGGGPAQNVQLTPKSYVAKFDATGSYVWSRLGVASIAGRAAVTPAGDVTSPMARS